MDSLIVSSIRTTIHVLLPVKNAFFKIVEKAFKIVENAFKIVKKAFKIVENAFKSIYKVKQQFANRSQHRH